VLDAGGQVAQETRGYSEDRDATFSLRGKEEAHDYRYFPEPDLPPLVVDDAFVERVRAGLPELPRAKRARFVGEMGLSPQAAHVLTSHPRIAAFFEEAATLHGQPARVANFVQSEVLRDVTTRGLSAAIPVSARQVASLLRLVDAGTISGKQAKEIYAKIAASDRMPEDVVKELGIAQVSDTASIEEACRRVVDQNPKQVAQYRAGKESLLGFFVGQVMKDMRGAGNPKVVNDTMRRLLRGP
jgi:aspartyl-tRNA(Asn)/glutamyl-tRNA(Gln) amidotransferase subunit B